MPSALTGHASSAHRDLSFERDSARIAFLERALSTNPISVARLELKARAAKLLGERQAITNAKRFKRAKAQLGIRSFRKGFGPAGEWFWAMPNRSGTPDPAESTSAASAILVTDEFGSERKRDFRFASQGPDRKGVPIEWVYRVNNLDKDPPPGGVPAHIWRQFVHDCQKFIDYWAAKAAALGWTAEGLFGCAPTQPLAHLQLAGLLWALRGRTLTRLYRDFAFIQNADGSHDVFNRRDSKGRRSACPGGCRGRI
jgi:hypothetical protein